jgi:hypothetical protein
MEKFRVLVWRGSCRDEEEEVIGDAFQSWEDAANAGAEYCGQLPYRYRVEQDDPD